MVNIEETKKLLTELNFAKVEYDGSIFKSLNYGEIYTIGFWESKLTVSAIDRVNELAKQQPEAPMSEGEYDYTSWCGMIIIDAPIPVDHPLLYYASQRNVLIAALITTPHNRRITLAEYKPHQRMWVFQSSSGNFVRYFLSLRG